MPAKAYMGASTESSWSDHSTHPRCTNITACITHENTPGMCSELKKHHACRLLPPLVHLGLSTVDLPQSHDRLAFARRKTIPVMIGLLITKSGSGGLGKQRLPEAYAP